MSKPYRVFITSFITLGMVVEFLEDHLLREKVLKYERYVKNVEPSRSPI